MAKKISLPASTPAPLIPRPASLPQVRPVPVEPPELDAVSYQWLEAIETLTPPAFALRSYNPQADVRSAADVLAYIEDHELMLRRCIHRGLLEQVDGDWRVSAIGKEAMSLYRINHRWAPTGQVSEKTAVKADELARMLALLGDGSGLQILSVARAENKSAEERMIAIVEIDKRYEGFNSVLWGELLNVSPARIRGTEYWKSRKHRKERGE